MTILYSEILKQIEPRLRELGFEGESHILKEQGDQVFGSTSAETLKALILEWEVNTRTLLREVEEAEKTLQEIRKENQQRNDIDKRIQAEIEKRYPVADIQQPFDTLYSGFLSATLAEVKKQAKFSLDDDLNLVVGETAETHPENLSELDRMLYNAKVSRFPRRDGTLDEVIEKAVNATGGNHFFNRHERRQ